MQPGEEAFVTTEAIHGTCVAGSPEEIAHQLTQMERNGLTGISLLPPAEFQRHHRLGEIAKDLALRFGWRQQADAGQTVALHLRKLMRNLLRRARDAGPENRPGRYANRLA